MSAKLTGVTGIFWAAPVADVFAMLITAVVMLRLWKELQGEAENTEPAAEGYIQPSRPGVIVTISREHGSAGKRIGQNRSITGSPWAYCDNYELCIDSSVGEQACAEMIFNYLNFRFQKA